MVGYLNRVARQAVISKLKEGEFLSGPHITMGWDDAKLIGFLEKHAFLSPADLREAVHVGICNCGRRCYEKHVGRQIYPDQALSPESLGYACLVGAVSKDEARQIQFDHGETLSEYLKNANGFLDRILMQIQALATQPEPIRSTFTDPCSCHD